MAVTGTIGRMQVEFGVDISELEKGIVKASKSIQDFGRGMKSLGKDITRSISLPMAGLAAIAVAFAKDIPAVSDAFQKLRDAGQSAGRAFGEAVAPAIIVLTGILIKFAGVVEGIANWFSKMPEWIKNTSVMLVAIGAVAGPLIITFGQLAIAIGALSTAMIWLQANMGPAGWISLAAGAGIAIAAIVAMGMATKRASGELFDFSSKSKIMEQSLADLSVKIEAVDKQTVLADMDLLATGDTFKRLSANVKEAEDRYKAYLEKAAQIKDLKPSDPLAQFRGGFTKIEGLGLTMEGDSFEDAIKTAGHFASAMEVAKQKVEDAKIGKAASESIAGFQKELSRFADNKEIFGNLSALTTQTQVYDNMIKTMSADMAEYGDRLPGVIAQQQLFLAQLQQAQLVADMFTGMRDIVTDALDSMGESFAKLIIQGGSFAKAMVSVMKSMAQSMLSLIISTMMKILSAKLLESTAGVIASVFTSVPFPLNFALVGGAIAGVAALFSGLKMAEGGIVNSPTIAMIGEAGPEAVIPLDRMGGGMMGGNQQIYVQLDGRTIAESAVRNMPSVLRVQTGIMT